MPVKFRDYYEVLGVPRDATQEQIQRAYRDLARKWHPDVNKAKDAEQRFKEINEANEVLKDPEKRKRYDTLGADWKNGQEFTPPPGFDGAQFEFRGDPRDLGGFSDFFQSLFGGGFAEAFEQQQRPRAGRRRAREPEPEPQAAAFRIDVTPWEAALGAEVSLRAFGNDIQLKIPPGTSSAQKLRLRGVGPQHGDLIVEIRIVMPKALSPKERELFEQLRKESKFRPEQRGR